MNDEDLRDFAAFFALMSIVLLCMWGAFHVAF